MDKSRIGVLALAVAGFCVLSGGTAVAGTVEANPGNYRELIPKLSPATR